MRTVRTYGAAKARRAAFTLIELLVVVVVIVTLMTVVFRLSGMGASARARNETAARIQKVENALSGYFAAFGSYPPVPLQGRSRNIYLRVDDHGLQMDDENVLKLTDDRAWEQVEAACRSQPVGAKFPCNRRMKDLVAAQSSMLKMRAAGEIASSTEVKNHRATYTAGFDSLSENTGRLNRYLDKTSWRELQLFQFGLASFILPRYLFMLDGSEDMLYDRCAQWKANNTLPARFKDGVQYASWAAVRRVLGNGDYTASGGAEAQGITNLASQAVCARWMPNLAEIVKTKQTRLEFYGVNVRESDGSEMSPSYREIYTPGGYKNPNSTSQQYVLDSLTIEDGWNRELYYYSPPPYQTYRLWSAGPNAKTFPPWLDIKKTLTSASDQETASAWIVDDIVHMSN